MLGKTDIKLLKQCLNKAQLRSPNHKASCRLTTKNPHKQTFGCIKKKVEEHSLPVVDFVLVFQLLQGRDTSSTALKNQGVIGSL